MIKRETFIKAINDIINTDKRLDELNKVNSYASSLVMDYTLEDSLIMVLAVAMNLPIDPRFGSTISWWIYDTKCGKDKPFIWIGKGSRNERKLNLDTVEKLYDFCLEEGKKNVKH